MYMYLYIYVHVHYCPMKRNSFQGRKCFQAIEGQQRLSLLWLDALWVKRSGGSHPAALVSNSWRWRRRLTFCCLRLLGILLLTPACAWCARA
jgi:hypothetical protein